jgi:hypothetical protein
MRKNKEIVLRHIQVNNQIENGGIWVIFVEQKEQNGHQLREREKEMEHHN